MVSGTDVTEGDHLAKVYSSIRRANLALDGSSVKQKRTSTLAPADRLHVENSKELMFSRKLSSLQRTLRVSALFLKLTAQMFQSLAMKVPTKLRNAASCHCTTPCWLRAVVRVQCEKGSDSGQLVLV